MTRLLTTLLPLVLAAFALSANAADSNPLDSLLKPDAAGPLGGTLTGLQYTGFGLSHIKRGVASDAESSLEGSAGSLTQSAQQLGSDAPGALKSDLTYGGAQAADSLKSSAAKEAEEDNVRVPSPQAVQDALKSSGKYVQTPGGALENLRRRGDAQVPQAHAARDGPKIDGMDIVALPTGPGGSKASSEEVMKGLTTVGQTAAGAAVGPYLNTVKTGVSAAGGIVEAADQAYGAAKQAAEDSKKKTRDIEERVYTPALALFPGAGPEAVELGNQIKNTLGLPTPPTAGSGAGQKRFHQKRNRRHP